MRNSGNASLCCILAIVAVLIVVLVVVGVVPCPVGTHSHDTVKNGTDNGRPPDPQDVSRRFDRFGFFNMSSQPVNVFIELKRKDNSVTKYPLDPPPPAPPIPHQTVQPGELWGMVLNDEPGPNGEIVAVRCDVEIGGIHHTRDLDAANWNEPFYGPFSYFMSATFWFGEPGADPNFNTLCGEGVLAHYWVWPDTRPLPGD